MKKLLTTLVLFVAVLGYSQTATHTTTSTKPTPINAWSLYQTETFNAVHAPTATEKGDLLLLTADGNYRLIMEGVVETGKYQLNSTNTQITLVASATGTTKIFKVLECTATNLKIDYKDETDIHNILYYKTGGTATTSTSTGK